jgi:hypothetical protein
MAFISGLQSGFAAHGFSAGFLGGTARFGVLGNGFGATRFGLFQRFTCGSESRFGFGNMLGGSLFFPVRYSAGKGGFMIRTQRRMGFACAAQSCFSGGQFRFGSLQLRGTRSSSFGGLISGAFGFAYCLNRFGQGCAGRIAPRRQGGFAFNQPCVFFSDARTRRISITSQGSGMGQILA